MEARLLSIGLLRYSNVILALFGLSFWIYLYAKYKQPGSISPILWLADVSAFYIYVLIVSGMTFTEDIIENLNIWAASIHLFAGILLVAAAFIINDFLKHKKCKKYQI